MQKQKSTKAKDPRHHEETFKLKFPFEFEGKLIEQISLRRPTVLDLERIESEEGGTTKSLIMLSNLSGLAPDTIRRMDAHDFNEINEVLLDFLGWSQRS